MNDKEKILEAINIRLTMLSQTLRILEKEPLLSTVKIDTEARFDELESLYHYIDKQME